MIDPRRCHECSKSFLPSSGHLRCPSCRSKDLCRCGSPKQRLSTRCAACRSADGGEQGERNGGWKGGRIYHKKGYVMVHAPDHPRARSGPYVFEHILVMEAELGRHLRADETVHHRNGVRDDNRPENLELWAKSHPAGIRVEDALAWAREILHRYGGPPDAPRPP